MTTTPPENEPESTLVPDSTTQPTPEAQNDIPAQDADHTDTAIIEPVMGEDDTQVMPPIEDDTAADASDTTSAEVPEDVAEVPDDAADAVDDPESPPSSRRNSLGVWAVVTGALLLFPIALALGHLGLRANKQGEANNKSVALAGVILGYIGLVVAFVGTAIALFVVWPNVEAQNTDNAAKSDVITLGSSLVAAAAAGEEPSLWDGVSAWSASDEMLLDSEPGVAVAANNVFDWCLVLTYQGGNVPAVAYSSASGLQDGPTCS